GGREPAHSLPAPQGRAGGGVSAPALNGAAERVRWLKECPGPVTSGYVPMTRSARVTSIQTVEAFKGALCEFGKDARDALCAADLAVRRAVDWLKAQQQFWQRELRKRQEDVVQAKKELTARKYQNRDGRGLGSTEQEKALKKAQDRQREAETKLANCKRWAPELHHAVTEYEGPTRQLAGPLDTDLVQAVALLEHKLEALEAYLRLAPPDLPGLAPEATGMGSAAVGEPVAVEAPASGEREPPGEGHQGVDTPRSPEEQEVQP